MPMRCSCTHAAWSGNAPYPNLARRGEAEAGHRGTRNAGSAVMCGIGVGEAPVVPNRQPEGARIGASRLLLRRRAALGRAPVRTPATPTLQCALLLAAAGCRTVRRRWPCAARVLGLSVWSSGGAGGRDCGCESGQTGLRIQQLTPGSGDRTMLAVRGQVQGSGRTESTGLLQPQT